MRELRVPYDVVPDPSLTKSKILMESAKLFALSGYSAVSVRDISTAIGITPATIYCHFTGKQDILDKIMERCGRELHDFYQLLDKLSGEAESFGEILNNMFVEAKEVTNPFSFYAIWCAMHTQFEYESSHRLYYEIYFEEGHMAMWRQLEIAIRRGLVQPFDVGEIASLVTNCFLTMVGVHVGKLNGFYQNFDIPEWYSRQINHILRVTSKTS